MPWDTGLAGVHLAIAGYPNSPLRVLAGPGTGKTYAMMRRVARLLEVAGVPPTQILAVTFTRTAAHDLIDKLTALGVPGANQVIAKTLHGLSFSILGRAAVFQATGRVPRPLLACELDMMVNDLKEVFGGKREVRRLVKAFEAYWAKLQHHTPGWPADPLERQFDRALKDWLRFHRAMLIGELIPIAHDFVRSNPGHQDIPVYAHVLVDEYQDLNKADQVLIDLLAANGDVTVVGDEDQSIYSFRHANPEGIVDYPNTHQNTHDEALVECRRCPQLVVQLASSLITHNARQNPKNLNACAANRQGTVYIVQHPSVVDETDCLSAYVEQFLVANPDVPAGEMLILSNRRLIGNGIRDNLNERAEQNHHAWSASSFYYEDALSEEEAAVGFAVLTLLVDVQDRPALRTWLGASSADGRSGSYKRLRDHCEAIGMTPYDAMQGVVAGTVNIPYIAPLRSRFVALTRRLATLQNAPLQNIIDDIFPAHVPVCGEARALALTAMVNAADADELLEELRILITQPEIPGSQGNSVRIMSLHKSKGLTARVVIIAGCVAGILPTIDFDVPIQEQERQRHEQRRLFYVGITRSTDTLVISSARSMPFGDAKNCGVRIVRRSGAAGRTAILQASEFIAELGPSAPATAACERWRQALNF
jgi:DNA helicase-2/ATP-dependent DNA helicase PcrA